MLHYLTEPSRTSLFPLSADEDRKLRLAFGRFAEAWHRQAGADVVAVHYNQDRRFYCDCYPDVERAPQLFLVSGTHIRREPDGKGTPHDESCDFAREPDEQKKLVLSYRQQPDEYRLDLVRDFSATKTLVSTTETLSVTMRRSRPSLARVLCSFLHTAALDRFFSMTPLHGDRDQQNGDLLEAAEKYTLDPGQPLRPWLALSLRDYYRLKERLNQSLSFWKHPHGLFIETFDRIENNILYPKRSDLKPIKVNGRITVFGENRTLHRPPYLVICLLSLPSRNARSVEIVRAYAHPCVAWDRLTLVDSQNERDTLALLIECRDRLAKDHNISFTIEKPLHDKGPEETDDPREVCIPDFVLRPRGQNIRHPLIVVETMGYSDDNYRERKQRMRPLFEHIGPGPYPVPVIEHDCSHHTTPDREADQEFQRKVMKAIIG